MAALGKRALFEAIRSFDSSMLNATFQDLGTELTNPSVLMKLVNNSNILVTLSYDGVTEHDVLPAGSFVIYDFGSDAQDVSEGGRLSLSSGTQVSIKSTTGAAGLGSVYLVIVYAGG